MFKISKNTYLIFTVFIGLNVYAQQRPSMNKGSNEEVIKSMTLQEKVFLLTGLGDENWTNPQEGTETVLIDGNAGRTYAIERLGITPVVLADGPAGLRIDPQPRNKTFTRYATAFPTATALASSWNVDLVKKVGKATGNEVLEYGVDVLLSPAVNIHRNPLCGRNFEYYSEDPLLAGKLGAAFVKGVQYNGVGTSVKHFVANNMETNRTSLNSIISQRVLREIYLKPFEIIVKESDPWTVMSSYNRLNGLYTSENKDLLTTILRDEWNYKGLVMTDWWGGADAVAQLKAGNNLFMPGSYQREELLKALELHLIDETTIDKNLDRILDLIRKTPRFKNYKPSEKPDLAEHLQISKEAAGESMVLLKNINQTLPLNKKLKIGLFGKASYSFIVGGTGSGEVNYEKANSLDEVLQEVGYQLNDKLFKSYKTLIDSLQKNPPKDTNVKFVIDLQPEFRISSSDILNAAKSTDLAIISIGRNAGEGSDRLVSDFYLTDVEKQLIKEVSDAYHSLGKKVIIILNIGGVIVVNDWQNYADAILLTWQTGQKGAEAMVDILQGIVNPSGKLPMTFPLQYDNVPSSNYFPGEPKENPIDSYYNEGIYVGYRYYDTFHVPVSYEFGYGLSYTNFEFSNINVTGNIEQGNVEVVFDVKNIGKLPGKEVTQLYISAPKTGLQKPDKELKGFVKTKPLKPKETQQIKIKLDLKDLASFNPALAAWVAQKGDYTILIGNSSKNIILQHTIHLENDVVTETVHDVLYPNKKLTELIQK